MIVGYGRVSNKSQDVSNQRVEIEREGFVLDLWFEDHGYSGVMPAENRPGLQAAISAVKKGDTLVVTRLDRIGRDAFDVLWAIRRVGYAGATIKVLQFPMLDMATPEGEAMATLAAAMSKLESRATSDRTKSGIYRSQKESGRTSNRALDDETVARVVLMRSIMTVSDVAKYFEISVRTVGRYAERKLD